jgi:two-component system nitrate/nitrite response regulator NarL
MTKTAIIIEDHPLYRDALIHLMQTIVGKSETVAVSSAEEGLRIAERLPNLALILLDLGLPGLNGIEAIIAFHRKLPLVPIIVVSASENRQEAAAALHAGAIAFVSKAVSAEVMTDAIQRLLAGALIEPEWITSNNKSKMRDELWPKLTERQHETLVLLSRGYSNKEIALHLGLAEITIKVHVSALFKALNVVNRTQAVLTARRLGIGI